MSAHQREHTVNAGHGLPSDRWSGRSRTAAAILLGGFAFIVFLVSSRPALTFRMDGLPTSAHGFYPAELREGLPFAWTGPHAELSVPGINRGVDWRWTGLVNIWRPGGVAPPRVRITVDGIVGPERTVDHDAARMEVMLPRRPGRTGATITVDVDPIFAPGGTDPRQLGLAFESIALTPVNGLLWPPWPALLAGTLAIVLLGATLAAIGLPATWVLVSVVVAAGSQTWLVTRGMATYDRYTLHAVALAFWLGLGVVLVVRGLERVRHRRLEPAACGVAGLSTLACYLKLLVLLHPDMPIGDGLFHAHRLERVLTGHFYFTSLAPGNYAFPYPILLYLLAAPFSFLTSNTLDRVALLRIVVTVADTAAGTLLYWMVVRTTAERVAAVGAVVWYHIIPVTAWIMTWGNLTNAFGQTLFVASLAAVVAVPVEWKSPSTVALLAGLAGAALLSHPSTCAILTIVLTCTALLYWQYGGQSLRGAARGVAVATFVAAGAAFVLYYAWFPAVYASELSRAASESTVRATQQASSLGYRLALTTNLAARLFGWPAVAAAGVGAWRLWHRTESARLTLLLAGWTGSCLVFLVVGVLTPIDMRYHFAAFPALAVVGAYGWSWAWRGGVPLRTVATFTLTAAAWVGVRQWMSMLQI